MSDQIKESLRKASTATLTSILGQRGITRVFMYGVAPLPGSRPRMVGRAFTMRSVAAREDQIRQDRARPPTYRTCRPPDTPGSIRRER